MISVKQNIEMAPGRRTGWMLPEMLLHGEVGTLAGKAGPMKSRETLHTGLLSEGGCSIVIFLNARCLLWEIRLLGALR